MRRKDKTTSHSKLVLSLGAATIVAVALFVVETKAQTSGVGLPNLEARVEPLRPGVTESQVLAELATHTLELKGLSPAIVALDKQKVVLAQYKSNVLNLRMEMAGQYRQAWKRLVIRLLVVTLIIGLLFAIGYVSRRLAQRRVQDPNRQRLIGMIYHSLTLFAIAVVILFVLASDLKSVATYFGLLSAGLLLALQNVILASLGSLLLVGKRGIRIGDRVRVSGVTGDVIDMGLLQFQLREFDTEHARFTGHVATFSNSLVLVSPATGLLKLNSAPQEAATAAKASATEPDAKKDKLAARGAL